jgi:hypothetical protein
VDTKFWTRAQYPDSQARGMRVQTIDEVTRYLAADRILDAQGNVQRMVPDGFASLTLEFPGEIPRQFRPALEDLRAQYDGRLVLDENRRF